MGKPLLNIFAGFVRGDASWFGGHPALSPIAFWLSDKSKSNANALRKPINL
jgi:hypothetical protein